MTKTIDDKTKNRNYFPPLVLLTTLVSLFAGQKISENKKNPQEKNIEVIIANTISKDRNLKTWIQQYQDSSFCLDDADYYWDKYSLYDKDNDGKEDGIFIVFNKKTRPMGSLWTGALGYFEFDKEGGGKINPNAKIVYPFRRWNSQDFGNGLKDTNGNGKLNKIMDFDETNKFSKTVHYPPKKGKTI